MSRTNVNVALTLSLLFACAAQGGESLDQSFEALKVYDWGSDRAVLQPIEGAIAATLKDVAARKAIETRLAEVLKAQSPQAAKDYACRQLSLIGTAESVPAIASLLGDEKLSHMARYALERIPDPAAVQALRDALDKAAGLRKVGVIQSLGVRRDAASISALIPLLSDSDAQIAGAAASALGSIGTAEAAKALGEALTKVPEALRLVVADANLACAERLLADGKKAEALAIYKTLSKAELPKHVQVAATRGLLAAMGKK